MKKLALIVAVAGIVGLSACSKKGDIVCKQNFLTVTWKYTVSEDNVEYCVATVCNDIGLGGQTQAEYVKDLEDAGYNCK